MAGAEFAHPVRQVAVALDPLVEDLDVARAVHRLDRVVPVLRGRGEHVLAVVLPVPGPLPDAAVEDHRTAHLEIAVVAIDAAHVLLDLLPQSPALRVPEHQAGGLVLQMEQVELPAETPVVALFRLLQHLQVGVLVLLLRPRRAVDPLQHLVLRVAAPVGAGQPHQLEHLELAGRGHVRPAAQVDEIALLVERNLARPTGIEAMISALYSSPWSRKNFTASSRGITLRTTGMSRLAISPMRFSIAARSSGRERALVGEVVVEAVFDHRADRDLRLREQLLDRVREQVRRRMAQDLEALGVALGDDRELGVALDRDSWCRPGGRRPCPPAPPAPGRRRSTGRPRPP